MMPAFNIMKPSDQMIERVPIDLPKVLMKIPCLMKFNRFEAYNLVETSDWQTHHRRMHLIQFAVSFERITEQGWFGVKAEFVFGCSCETSTVRIVVDNSRVSTNALEQLIVVKRLPCWRQDHRSGLNCADPSSWEAIRVHRLPCWLSLANMTE